MPTKDSESQTRPLFKLVTDAKLKETPKLKSPRTKKLKQQAAEKQLGQNPIDKSTPTTGKQDGKRSIKKEKKRKKQK